MRTWPMLLAGPSGPYRSYSARCGPTRPGNIGSGPASSGSRPNGTRRGLRLRSGRRSRLAMLLPSLLLAIAATGCANRGSGGDVTPAAMMPPTINGALGCGWVEPIYVSEASIAAMSDETAAAILAHNEAWRQVCGNASR